MIHVVLALVLTLAAGCASAPPEQRRLEEDLLGRWTGDPVAVPAHAWWAGARFDVSFAAPGIISHGRDFSVLMTTYDGHAHPLRFEGTYEVASATRLDVDEENLGGHWDVARRGKDEITLTRGEMVLALRKRYGS
jgi:hypothetical protein